MNENILKQIKECREQKGITLKELSEKSNISYSYLLMLEKGKKKNPSLNVITKITNVLDVSVTILYI